MNDEIRELQQYVEHLSKRFSVHERWAINEIKELKDSCRNAIANLWKKLEKKDRQINELKEEIEWIMRYKEGPTS